MSRWHYLRLRLRVLWYRLWPPIVCACRGHDPGYVRSGEGGYIRICRRCWHVVTEEAQ